MSENLVEARGLVLGYDDHVAVAASDLVLPRGELTAIIGPNGSGKSTMLHAIAGTIVPMAGELRVAGKNPRAANPDVCYVMQTVDIPRGIPITVREAVMMGRYPQLGWFRRPGKADRAKVLAAMERLEIADLADRHLGELSGGQRQRVHVAQGIAQDHDVLLLDEPLTGLDLVSARTIDRIIHDEHECGCTVIYTTHDLDEAAAADRVVLMSGRVVAAGRPAEVLTRANLEAAYGLGALHEGSGFVLDDPAPGHHAHEGPSWGA